MLILGDIPEPLSVRANDRAHRPVGNLVIEDAEQPGELIGDFQSRLGVMFHESSAQNAQCARECAKPCFLDFSM